MTSRFTTTCRGTLFGTALCTGLALAGGELSAQEGMPPTRTLEARVEDASMRDKTNAQVDANLTFTDERGYPYQLKQLFPGKRPVVLLLGYYTCPAMCGQVMQAAFRALNDVALEPGQDYQVLSVSIDPRETAATAKQRKDAFLPKFAKIGAADGWRVCVGDAENIRQLTETVGFRYYWSEHTNQYAHPPAVIFLTPDGRVSRTIVNTEFDPDDLHLALVEASAGKLGTLWDAVRLNCLTFDSRTNSYSMQAMTVMQIGGAITVVALAGMILFMLRKERQRPQPSLA
ncbi:MAG: SCO family protein [Planctomycetota bacterium]|nr:SCO family protein [Planctomycetota bacterium]